MREDRLDDATLDEPRVKALDRARRRFGRDGLVCSIDDCDSPVEAQSLCAKHYVRLSRHGDPLVVKNGVGLTLAERFAKRTKPAENGCIHWTGALTTEGYGAFAVGRKKLSAHRWVMGDVPAGMHVDHTCHNADTTCPGGRACLHRRCVNPDHLEVVTPAVNARRNLDRLARARA